jgi:signal peptidase
LFLTLEKTPVYIGEIVVFKLKGKDIPIVHRVLEIHSKNGGKDFILTKGDNNNVDDRGLYNQGLWMRGLL